MLSAAVQHWPDFFIILVLLFANALVGFWEEFQAGNAIAALKGKLAVKARVRRDGKWTTVERRELVPGDVVRIRLGDIVPADARLLDGDPVEIDQSALTGESLPVTRKPGESVYSGSVVRQGEVDALIYAIPLHLADVLAPTTLEEMDPALRESLEGDLRKFASRHARKDVPITFQLRVGIPSHKIIEEAERVDAHMIVIGILGLTGLQRMLAGSVAERVVRHSTRPVLTVRYRENE